MKRRGPWIACVFAIMAAFFPLSAMAARSSVSTPKILNLYLGWQIKPQDQAKLPQWDVVVLDMDMQWQAPDKMRQLRRDNPNIKILAYVSAGELADARAQGDHSSPGYHLSQIAPEQFYMHSSKGNRLTWWPGAELMNATDLGPTVNGKRWADALPQFVHDEMMSTGLWDGVFLDTAYGDVTSFFGNDIDPDANGVANAPSDVNAAWRAGMTRLIKNMRTAVGPDRLIMNNSSDVYAAQVNGVLFENFPRYGWTEPFKELRNAVAKNVKPAVSAFNTNTNNQETPNDYRAMRFGLGSALLGGGYYSFDAGDRGHERTWWYDEYDTSIGAPKAGPSMVLGTSKDSVGVWRREFENGIVLVNTDTVPHHVDLSGTYEKIHGTQDVHTNDGSLIRSVDLPAQDAIILLGHADATEIRGGAYANGAFVRAYTSDGSIARNGFFAQRTDEPSGVGIIQTTLANGDDALVVAQSGSVTIHPLVGGSDTVISPFGPKYKGRLSIAAGRTKNGTPIIVVGRDKAKSPDVRIYTMTGKELARWTAYQPSFNGGVRVAVGDLTGTGEPFIVTGAGPGGGPHIRISKMDGTAASGSFFAFNQNESGGVSVAVGDVDGDGKAEILVGSGEGAIPRVRIFDIRGTLKRELTLGNRPVSTGITVTAADINGDGKPEILVSGINPF